MKTAKLLKVVFTLTLCFGFVVGSGTKPICMSWTDGDSYDAAALLTLDLVLI